MLSVRPHQPDSQRPRTACGQLCRAVSCVSWSPPAPAAGLQIDRRRRSCHVVREHASPCVSLRASVRIRRHTRGGRRGSGPQAPMRMPPPPLEPRRWALRPSPDSQLRPRGCAQGPHWRMRLRNQRRPPDRPRPRLRSPPGQAIRALPRPSAPPPPGPLVPRAPPRRWKRRHLARTARVLPPRRRRPIPRARTLAHSRQPRRFHADWCAPCEPTPPGVGRPPPRAFGRRASIAERRTARD